MSAPKEIYNKNRYEYNKKQAIEIAERKKKAKAKKVKLSLDEYHRRMGGIYDKKVIFYCMPDDHIKTRKAKRLFEKNGGGAEGGLFITITDENHEQGNGLLINKEEEIIIDPIHSFIIIDNIHLISTNKIIKILNDFRSSVTTGKLLFFGTNADKTGKPIRGARHLERVADQVFYETDPCYFCGKYGKTSFTKRLFEEYEPHPSDCVIYGEDDEKDGYYHEKDLCFDCRYKNTKKKNDSDDDSS